MGDVVNNLLFWLHLVGLGLGATASFGIAVVGSRMRAATPEQRGALFGVTGGLSTVGRAGFAILIVTGPLVAWLKYGNAYQAFGAWFSVKMVCVILLLISVIFSGILGKRAETGDMSAAKLLPRLGMLNIALLLIIILAAVFAFN